MKLFMNLFMSAIFLFIFSFVMKSASLGLDHPMNYLISGIIIMTVFQSSLNNSMNILDDISTGFMKEILVAPLLRWQIAIGHVLSSTLIAVIQGLIIVFVGFFMGLNIDFLHGLAMVGMMFLVGLTFSTMGLFLATVTKESTNFQLLVAILTFPLTFLSGALIPTIALPSYLLPIVYINPLTYSTAAFRYISLHMENVSTEQLIQVGVAFKLGSFVITPIMSTLMMLIIGSIFFYLCVRGFNRADFSKVKSFKRRH